MIVTRALVGQATTVTLTAYTDGTQTDQGTFTVSAVDANGTSVSVGSVTDNSDGTYEVTVPKQTAPKLITLTWTESGGTVYTTYVEVVGSLLFDEAQMRAHEASLVSSSSTYPDAAILDAHDRVADYLESQTSRSWIRRYCRVELCGTGGYDIYVGDGTPVTATGAYLYRPGHGRDVITVLSATIDGTAVNDVTAHPDGRLTRTGGTWTHPTATNPHNVVVEYEYGLPYPVDEVDRIAMMAARHQLVTSRVPANAQSFTDALGSYTFDETRLPFEAWKWINQHRVGAFFG